MLLGYPISEIALLALWIVAAGVLVGILAGLFGIGGGAIIVPVLYEVFRVLGVPEDVRIQACIGTSLAIIVPCSRSPFSSLSASSPYACCSVASAGSSATSYPAVACLRSMV